MAFGAQVVFVPVPGSMPLQRADWVGERLAWCLKEVGLAAAVWPILRRRHTVRKSAFAASGERPTVLEHYASFAVEPVFSGGGLQLTLVDDVITRGRTLLAAAGRVRDAFPGAEIRAFALLRTLSPDETLRQILAPCEGEVRWVSGDARRRP
jgi:predicted amidophosphoribosyltransferase